MTIGLNKNEITRILSEHGVTDSGLINAISEVIETNNKRLQDDIVSYLADEMEREMRASGRRPYL